MNKALSPQAMASKAEADSAQGQATSPGKALPRQSRALQKRRALISAAQQDFTELGYENATAKSIAKRAGVATGTFYQYFHNKDDMLQVIAQERFEMLFEEVSGPAATPVDESIYTTFRRILSLIYDYHESDPKLHQILEHRRHCDEALASILNEGEAILEQRVRLFVQSFNIDNAEAIAFALFAMAEGLVHRHVFHDESKHRIDKTQVIDQGAEMLASYFASLPNARPKRGQTT